jgi:hypothetical protein
LESFGRAVYMHQLDVHHQCTVETLSASNHSVNHHERHHVQYYMEGSAYLMKLVFVISSYVKKGSLSFSMQSLGSGYLMKSAVERMQG